MTEDEAKTKWCPFAVASHTDPRGIAGYARPDLGLPADTFTHACIASDCMAWRSGDYYGGRCGLAGSAGS